MTKITSVEQALETVTKNGRALQYVPEDMMTPEIIAAAETKEQ